MVGLVHSLFFFVRKGIHSNRKKCTPISPMLPRERMKRMQEGVVAGPNNRNEELDSFLMTQLPCISMLLHQTLEGKFIILRYKWGLKDNPSLIQISWVIFCLRFLTLGIPVEGKDNA